MMDWKMGLGAAFTGIAQMFRESVGRPRNIEGEDTLVEVGRLSSSINWMKMRPSGEWELLSTDELIRKFGWKIYREMLADETIKACLAFKKVLIHQRDWDIESADAAERSKMRKQARKQAQQAEAMAKAAAEAKAADSALAVNDAKAKALLRKSPVKNADGADPLEMGEEGMSEFEKQADFVRNNLRDIGMNRILRAILTAFEFGFSAGEILWEVKKDKEGELKVFIKDVKHRDPEYIRIMTDKHGNIVKFKQEPGTGEIIDIDPEDVLHYAYGGEFSNHYGVSDLRAAYRSWWSKKFVTQFWNVFLERFGQPLMKMNYPVGATPELKENLRKILNSLSSRSDMLVPTGVEVELIEATRGGNASYADALMYCDVAESRAILVPALLGMGVDIKRGSDSQSRLHLRVLMKIVGDVSQDIEFAINKIVKRLIDMNYPDVKEYPKFVFRDYGEYDATQIVDAAINMFNAGMLDVDQSDLNYLRSVLALPLRDADDEDEVLRSSPPPMGTSPNDPNATGDGAWKNNDRSTKGPAEKKSATE